MSIRVALSCCSSSCALLLCHWIRIFSDSVSKS